jgi:DNA repair exonuclease SbcCD ATPase subunit
MVALREDKSKLEMILDKKIEEAHKLSSRVDDLELQLNEAKEDCQRMASKTKKVIKAHGRYMKAQEDLKRSQARFERLADLLASDTLKPCIKEHGSSGNAIEDQYNAYEISPNDQRQNHVSSDRKRSIVLSTSEEAKIGKKRRENDDDVVQVAEKYRPEHALEPSDNSKGNGMPKSFSAQKKLVEGDYNEGGNIVSSSNVFTDRYGVEDDMDVHVD